MQSETQIDNNQMFISLQELCVKELKHTPELLDTSIHRVNRTCRLFYAILDSFGDEFNMMVDMISDNNTISWFNTNIPIFVFISVDLTAVFERIKNALKVFGSDVVLIESLTPKRIVVTDSMFNDRFEFDLLPFNSPIKQISRNRMKEKISYLKRVCVNRQIKNLDI